MSTATSAHAWSWVMYGSFALIIAISGARWVYPSSFASFWDKIEKGKVKRELLFAGWIAFMLTGFAIAWHELDWFATYFIVNPNLYDVWMNLQVYGSFIAFSAEGLFAWYILGHYAKEWSFSRIFNLKVLALGALAVYLFQIAWASIGYPLTLDLKTGMAPPALFGNLPTDFIEYASWLLRFTVVGAAYYARATKAKAEV